MSSERKMKMKNCGKFHLCFVFSASKQKFFLLQKKNQHQELREKFVFPDKFANDRKSKQWDLFYGMSKIIKKKKTKSMLP